MEYLQMWGSMLSTFRGSHLILRVAVIGPTEAQKRLNSLPKFTQLVCGWS